MMATLDSGAYKHGLHYWHGWYHCAHCLVPMHNLKPGDCEGKVPDPHLGYGWLCVVCRLLLVLDIALRQAIPPGCQYQAGAVNVPDPRIKPRRPKRGRANLIGCREAEALKPVQ